MKNPFKGHKHRRETEQKSPCKYLQAHTSSASSSTHTFWPFASKDNNKRPNENGNSLSIICTSKIRVFEKAN